MKRLPLIVLLQLLIALRAEAQQTSTVTGPAPVEYPVVEASVPPEPEAEPPPPSKESKPGIEVTAAPGKGFTITAGDTFQSNLKLRIVPRETFRREPDDEKNEINIRTARVTASGYVLSPKLSYYFQLALGGTDVVANSASPIYDAYVDFKWLRDASLRVGQGYVQFDRARTVREFALQTVERSQVVNEFNLDRDVGLILWSDDLAGLGGALSYRLGIYGGEGRNRFGTTTASYLYVGRISLRPFGAFDDDQEADLERLDKLRIALGVGAGFNNQTDEPKSTTGTPLRFAKFDYRHFDADLVVKYGGFSLLAEWLLRRADRDFVAGTSATGAPTREYSRSGWGLLAQVGYLFLPNVEVVGRYDQLHAGPGTDPTFESQVKASGKELSFGLNYYLNGHAFKVQADYTRLFGDDFSTGIDQVRAQIDATF